MSAVIPMASLDDDDDKGEEKEVPAQAPSPAPSEEAAEAAGDVVMTSDIDNSSSEEESTTIRRKKKRKHKKKHKKRHKKKGHSRSGRKRHREEEEEEQSDNESDASGGESASSEAAPPAAKEGGPAKIIEDDDDEEKAPPSKRRRKKEEDDAAADETRISLHDSPPPSSTTAADSPPMRRLTKAMFDQSYEAFNLLIDSQFDRNKVVTSVVIPHQDLMRVIESIGGMKLSKVQCWIVKDYIPPCDAHIKEATELQPAVLCNEPSHWVLKVDGHFVCDKHKGDDPKASTRTSLASAFTGVIFVATNKLDLAIRAHVPGFIEGDIGHITDFDLDINTATAMLKRCWLYRHSTCQNVRIAITEDEEDQGMSNIRFSPQTRRIDSKKVSGLIVDCEEIRRFPASLVMPDQINVDTSVTMMLTIPLLAGFNDLFNGASGSDVELTVDQLKCKEGTSNRILNSGTELLSFTFRGGLDVTCSMVKNRRCFYSATKVIKTEATPSAVDSSVGFATTRVANMNLDRPTIARILKKNTTTTSDGMVVFRDFEPVHLVRTRYARGNLVNAAKVVLHKFNNESVLLFTGREEQMPLVWSHSLPHGGILMITLGVVGAPDEDEEEE